MTEWISVKERLPSETNTEYICCAQNSKTKIVLALIFSGEAFGRNESSINWMEFITHWQPLPQPPKE